jgi:hypothetical protein
MLAYYGAHQRGQTRTNWLQSAHSFSFGHFRHPTLNGFGPLVVLNEDIVAPGGGFGTHPHKNMEILSYVLEGTLEHKDSMGNGSRIIPGDLQKMSAGTGVTHSEHNPSTTHPVHFLQMWVQCDQLDRPPSYEQKHFPEEGLRNQFCLLASRNGSKGSISIHQDVSLSVTKLEEGMSLTYPINKGRAIWAHLARGTISVNGQPLQAGDAIAATHHDRLDLFGIGGGELLLFDVIAPD